MSNLPKAAEMALEALEGIHPGNMTPMAENTWCSAKEYLRQALAQPEQEPVTFPDAPTTIYLQVCDDMDCGESFYDHTDVSWCDDQINDSDIKYIRADIAPLKREWVGLTDEAIWLEYQMLWPFHPAEEPRLAADIVKFSRTIEAKLKEKNK